MANYLITLRDTRTGEERTITGDYDDDDSVDWMWNMGNYRCDCNRNLLFYSLDMEDERNVECSDDMILLVSIKREDGTEVHSIWN